MSVPIRVLVDASILKPNLGGIRTYTRSVVKALAREDEVELHVATSMPDDFAGLALDVLPVPLRTRNFVPRALWRDMSLANLVRMTRAQVVFVPCPELPFRPLPVPTAMMVYDVGPVVAPAYFTRAKHLRFALDLPRTCRAASTVVCVSNATLTALHGATATDPDKCVVIGGGPSEQTRDRPARQAPRGRPYVLYVGSLLRHKNVSTLVRAFAHGPPGTYDLILAGPRTAAETATFDSLVDRLDLKGKVRHLGWVDDLVLADLYSGALAVAVPSLHEGYGLPALEAMGFGVPVVASDIPAVRELGGDALLYVPEPLRPGSWRRQLDAVTALVGQSDLGERGRQRTGSHTWEGAADAYFSLFRRLAS